jgi:hypothetical protein
LSVQIVGRFTVQTARGVRGRAAGWLVFVPIVGLHGLFLATYPLNNRGGDTANYFQMLVDGKSSLVHAGGYPFLAGLLFRRAPFASMAAYAPASFDSSLQVMQHAVLLSAMAVLFAFVRRIYGSITAVLATLSLGLNLQLVGAASSAYPEWLQAALLILAGCAAGYAFLQTSGAGKAALYGLSVVFFTWCFLVKFNAAVLAVLYVAPAVAERERLPRKLLWLIVFSALAIGNLAVYEYAFHQPTTGTRRLTADTGWVLLTRIQNVYSNELRPSSGLATKRWLALATALPMRYDFAGPGLFSQIDAVPAEVRGPYRKLFDRIMAADDRFLDDWLRTHPLPPGFNVGVSVIPVCYYVGLFEGNDLAVKVAAEAVRAQPAAYVHAVLNDVRRSAWEQERYPLFPLPANLESLGFAVAADHPDGRARLTQNPRPWDVPYGYRTPVVWSRGVRAFAWISEFRIPALLVSTLMAIALAATAVRAFMRGHIAVQDGIVLTLSVGLVGLVLASCMTLEFRWKELCLAMPLIAVLASVGVTWPLRIAAGAAGRLRRA